MLLARVVGSVWATHAIEGVGGHRLRLIAPLDPEGRPTGEMIVAADTIGCDTGQMVTVAFGSGARNVLDDQDLPLEAAINGIVDRVDDAPPRGRRA